MAVLGETINYSIDELEAGLGQHTIGQYVRQCEAGFLKSLSEIAYQTAWDPKIKAIFISGPTSSGKTTFTARLSAALHMHGRPTCELSLDDYYVDNLVPNYVDGRPDLESLETLDVPLMVEQIKSLLTGASVNVPNFEFKTRRRVQNPVKILRVPPRGVLLVEGLHGLSHEVSGALKEGEYLNVLIMPYATLFSDRKLIGPREIRVLRRLCRDAHQRNTTAIATLDYWPMLDYTEERIFPEYIARAHVFVNSAMAYEFCVIPNIAKHLLEKDLLAAAQGTLNGPGMVEGQSEYIDLDAALVFARRMLKICEKLPSIDAEIVPPNSILNEFIR